MRAEEVRRIVVTHLAHDVDDLCAASSLCRGRVQSRRSSGVDYSVRSETIDNV